MSDGDEENTSGLRVDRLAKAMDAARARARGEPHPAAQKLAEERRAAEEEERQKLLEAGRLAAARRRAEREAKEEEDRLKAEEARALRKAKDLEEQQKAEEAEAQRLAEEAESQRLAEKAEAQRFAEEAEAQRLAEEAEAQRMAKEAEAQRLAEEAEAQRLAEEAEAQRLAEEAEARRLAEEAEALRLAEEAEAQRLAEEAAAQRLAEEAEAQRLAEEVEAKRLAEEAEAQRLVDDAEAQRLAERNKARRLAEEAEERRLAEEARARRRAEAAEARRLAEEAEAQRLAEEAEAQRLAEKAEAQRLAEEAEAQRLAEEAEARRLAEEAEAQRLAEEAEAQRLAEEAEARRLAEEAESQRSVKETAEQPDTTPVSGEDPLVLTNPVLPETESETAEVVLSAEADPVGPEGDTVTQTESDRSSPTDSGSTIHIPVEAPRIYWDRPASDGSMPAKQSSVSLALAAARRNDFPEAVAPESTRAYPAANAPSLLSLSGIETDIGRYRILQGVDFDVPKGQVTMLLGRNGVGKTTTLRTIMGLWKPKAGKIRLRGDDIAGMPPSRIAKAGVGYVPEDMGIFRDLTVAENMALAAVSGRIERERLNWIFATFPQLKTFWRTPAGNLSGGQKQMLSVARVMVEKRRLYLIDEPTKGLAPAIVATLASALRDLKLQGASILLVEQNFAVAKALGDRAVVMDDGRTVWSGAMAELADDPELQERLMGLNLETN